MTGYPNKLKVGDKVAVIATARVINADAVNTGIKVIREWGLEVVIGKSIYKHHLLFAGTDDQRLEDLQWALDDPSIKAVICARGGYGTSRIIDGINWSEFIKNPKWVCGFSDVTALLCHVNSLGIPCLHSSMPQLFKDNPTTEDSESLRRALFQQEIFMEGATCEYNQQGSVEAELIGGNLSILVHLIGTKSDFDASEKILFLEEVDEHLYQVDRMMVQLVRSGKISNIAGLVVGHLTKMKEGDLKFGMNANGVIRSHLPHPGIPIAFGLPIGHESPNLTIPLGVPCRLEVTESGYSLKSKY